MNFLKKPKNSDKNENIRYNPKKAFNFCPFIEENDQASLHFIIKKILIFSLFFLLPNYSWIIHN